MGKISAFICGYRMNRHAITKDSFFVTHLSHLSAIVIIIIFIITTMGFSRTLILNMLSWIVVRT